MISALPDVSALADALLAAGNSTGGWSYARGSQSRLEPTAWALLALTGAASRPSQGVVASHRDFLMKCQRSDGWLVEDARWPVNIGFNALVAITWLTQRELVVADSLPRLLTALIKSKGIRLPASPSFSQDNSIQGWSWNDATFSWVEPTAWGALALKKAARARMVPETEAQARAQEADRLLIDRSCRNGGWNFGNSNVLGQDLFPHVPTTAAALIALQDRSGEPAVARSLSYLESHWADEPSALGLGLSLIALHVHDRPIDRLAARLRAHMAPWEQQPDSASARDHRVPPGSNLHGLAVAIAALNDNGSAFRI